MATKLTSLAQLKESLVKVNKKIAEILEAVTDAISEVNDAKADKVDMKALTIPNTGQVSFGIASNGALAGIYDHAQTRWIIAVPAGSKDVYFSGDRHIFDHYIDFLQKNVGLRWWNKNGSKVDIRNQAEQNLFQITLTPVDGTPEYGFLNVFEDKSMELTAYGSLMIRDYAAGQQCDLFKGVIVASGADYIRFGNGTQICWGFGFLSALAPRQTGSIAFTFPVPFAGVDYACSLTQLTDTGGSYNLSHCNTNNQLTGFTAYIVNGDMSITVNANTQWQYMAIGRWK